MLETQVQVRTLSDEGNEVLETKAIRDIILDPSGVHADDVLNALRAFCAQIIVDFEEDQAQDQA